MERRYHRGGGTTGHRWACCIGGYLERDDCWTWLSSRDVRVSSLVAQAAMSVKQPFRGVSAAHLVFQVSVATCCLENTAGFCMLTWTQALAFKDVRSPGIFIYRCEALACDEPTGHILAEFRCNHAPVTRHIFCLLRCISGASCLPGEAAPGCQQLSASAAVPSPGDGELGVPRGTCDVPAARAAVIRGQAEEGARLLRWSAPCRAFATWLNTPVRSQRGSGDVPLHKGTLGRTSTVWFF